MKRRYWLFLSLILLISSSCTQNEEPPVDVKIPTFRIDTHGNKIPSKSDTEYQEYAFCGIDYAYQQETFSDTQSKIKIRGTSSRWFDKKNYKIKFSINRSLFGLPENKKYNLLASYLDPCKLRDFLALDISYKMNSRSDRFAPRPEFSKLYIDDEYQGVYLFVEDIDDDKGRIDFAKYKVEDEQIPFLLEMDTIAYRTGEEGVDYFSLGTTDVFHYNGNSYADLLYVYDAPEKITSIQAQYIKDYVTSCREALVNKNLETFSTLVDVDAFIDYWLLGELFRNTDMAGRSVYMYRESIDSKLIFGPSWDFDYSCSRPYQLGPNQDYSLDNVNDRFYNYDWWKLFLEIDETENLIKNRYTNYLRDIYFESIEDAKQHFNKNKDLIIEDAFIWYSKDVEDINKLVEDNYNWTCEYFRLRMDFMDSLFKK